MRGKRGRGQRKEVLSDGVTKEHNREEKQERPHKSKKWPRRYIPRKRRDENKIGETKIGFLFLPFLREGRSLVAYEEDGDDESFCACGCKLGAAGPEPDEKSAAGF